MQRYAGTDLSKWTATDSITKPHRIAALSPPLLALSQSSEIHDLDPLAAELEFTSTPEDLIVGEAQLLETKLLAIDNEPSDQLPSVDAEVAVPGSGPLGEWRVSLSTSPFHDRGIWDLKQLKVDVPLTPSHIPGSPGLTADSRVLPSTITGLVPGLESDQSITDPDVADAELSNLINNVVAPFAAQVDYYVSNEQLVEVDTTMRVKVPQVDASPPQPPWAIATGDLMKITKRELLKDETHWVGVSKLEQSLAWRPFPAHLAKIKIEEDFDDGSLARYLRELDLESDIDSSLLAHGSRPSLFRHVESEDDELEVLNTASDFYHADRSDASGLEEVRSVLDQGGRTEQPSVPRAGLSATVSLNQGLKSKRKLVPEKTSKEKPTAHEPTVSGLAEIIKNRKRKIKAEGEDEMPPASNLNTFMRLQGRQHSTRNNNCHPPIVYEGGNLATAATTAGVQAPTLLPPEKALPAHQATPLPLPNIAAPQSAHQIILAITLLTNRHFIRRIQELLPCLEMIERDQLVPAKNSRAKQTPTTAQSTEADIALSPGTGLIMTTLQKLKQKPLPGHSRHFGVRERVAAVALRHERLLVMVSEGRPAPEDGAGSVAEPLDDRDCETMDDFNGFAATLVSEVQVHYVAGGEAELAYWVAASIRQYAVPRGGVRLLPDETLWERFLRTAGMNAFAAQVILATVRITGEDSGGIHAGSGSSMSNESGSLFGLAAFVTMGLQERLRRFSGVMGGEIVLRRVSEVVDGTWVSAASMY